MAWCKYSKWPAKDGIINCYFSSQSTFALKAITFSIAFVLAIDRCVWFGGGDVTFTKLSKKMVTRRYVISVKKLTLKHGTMLLNKLNDYITALHSLNIDELVILMMDVLALILK